MFHYKLILSFLSCLCLVIAFTGCGYQFGEDGIAARYHTISVPSVKGDWNGDLTSAIVKALSCSGCFEYRSDCAAAILNVKLMDLDDENIGFRYDRHKLGKIRNTIIPTESRLEATVEVSLVDAGSGENILGPVRLIAYVDFDHDYYTSRNGVNIFPSVS